ERQERRDGREISLPALPLFPALPALPALPAVMITIHGRVAAARQRLRRAGISPDEADLDARLLAAHLLGWDTVRFFAAAGAVQPAGFGNEYGALVARRAAREPISYIIGRH